MNGFREELRRNERTNSSESIGPTSEVGGSNQVDLEQFKDCLQFNHIFTELVVSLKYAFRQQQVIPSYLTKLF